MTDPTPDRQQPSGQPTPTQPGAPIGPPPAPAASEPPRAQEPWPQGQPAERSTGSPVDPAAPPPGVDERGRVRHGKVSAAWTGAVTAAILLIALIIFIAQNSAQVTIHFLGLDGRISLALALLIAAVGSVLLVAIPGTLRILQLRRALKRNVTAQR
jgi:lipopolysaccharide assembly protein A